MPKFRMLVNISGTRDGADWPAAGETVDLPKGEGADLIAAGFAVEATVAPPATEKAIVDTKPKRRG